MKNEFSSPPKFKLKNVLSFIAVILLFITLTIIQTYVYNVKGSPIILHAIVNLNLILLILVVIMLVRYLIRLYIERPGSRFRQKLVISFMISILFPSSFLFFVSTTFIRETLDKWFNPILGDPLDDAMSIVRILHKYYQERSLWFGKQISQIIQKDDLLNTRKKDKLETFLQEKQVEYNVGMIQLFDDQGVELTRVINENIPIGSVVSTPSANLKAALAGEKAPPILITAGGGTLYRSFVAMVDADEKVIGVLVINFFVTERLLPKLSRIHKSSDMFKQQMRMMRPIRRQYMYLFIIPTVLILFFATWFGFYLAKGVSLPIQKLAEGTRAITAGNLDFQLDIQAYDEIGILVDSFEQMRQELKKSREVMDTQNKELQTVNLQLDQKQHYMVSLLDSFTTGVIAMDGAGYVTNVNPAAQTMLQVEPQFMIGKKYQDAFNEESLQQMKDMIEKCFATSTPMIKKEIHFFSKRMTLHLSTSVTVMKEPEGELLGLALICEDLTELIKVQKVAAWSEVARRIAHEIKNPLTPIRLSAQRINRKIEKNEVDDALFKDCCSAIVREVDTIQRLVNSFSRFAKMPEAKPVSTDINHFIEKVLDGFTLLHPNIMVEKKFDRQIPVVHIDENLMKQALTNIIDNAVEAMNDQGQLLIKTSFDNFLRIVRVEICDDGKGIREEDKEKLFVPYFSTKKRGTGLGLAIVARIVADNYGYVRVTDNQPRGTRFIIELPVMIGPPTVVT